MVCPVSATSSGFQHILLDGSQRRSLIRLTGADVARFLQGLLSADIAPFGKFEITSYDNELLLKPIFGSSSSYLSVVTQDSLVYTGDPLADLPDHSTDFSRLLVWYGYGVFVDTNNSSNDFVAGDPSPSTREAEVAPGEGAPELSLGTGLFDFIPLEESGEIELVAGLQGGWHVDAAVRFSGFGPDDVILYYEALDDSANVISHTTSASLSASQIIVDDGDFVRLGDRVVFNVANGNALVSTTIVLRVVAEHGDTVLSDERQLTVVGNGVRVRINQKSSAPAACGQQQKTRDRPVAAINSSHRSFPRPTDSPSVAADSNGFLKPGHIPDEL